MALSSEDKKCYVLFCDEKYFYLMQNVIKLLDAFSPNKVLAYTINFTPKDDYKNVIWRTIHDANLLEFENTGSNHLIKNRWDKTMYSCFLKTSAVLNSLEEDFDHFIYLDVDTFPLKNIDALFDAGKNKARMYPILSRYLWEFMMYGGKGSPFADEGYNESKTLEWWLLQKLGLTEGSYKRSWYRSSCCFYYNKKSKFFWQEAVRILTNEEIIKNQNEFFGDESVINVLLWKYRGEDFFDIDSVIHLDWSDQLDTKDKMDSWLTELVSSPEQSPELISNWQGSHHFNKAYMLHGKVAKMYWKQDGEATSTKVNHEQALDLNKHFVNKLINTL